jgi:hypothetical protein
MFLENLRKFYHANGDGGGTGDGGEGGDKNLGGGDGGGEGGGDDDDDFSDMDPKRVAAYIEKTKGVKFDELEKIPGIKKGHQDLTKAHDTTVKAQKAVRLAMENRSATGRSLEGSSYDTLLAEGMELLGESGDADRRSTRDDNPPAHFSNFQPEVRKQIEETHNYLSRKSMLDPNGFFQKIMLPKIVDGMLKANREDRFEEEEKSFEKSNPEYTEHKEAIEAYRKKHGITGKDPETRAWLLKTVKRELEDENKELSKNEDKLTQKKERGAPPPGGGNRAAGDKGLTPTEKYRRRWEKGHPAKVD